MAVGLLPPGTLGNLTPDEEQKLQESWIHLLRLCGVSIPNDSDIADLSSELSQSLHGKYKSPSNFHQGLWGFILAEHPDALVLRFLRARKWDVEKAMNMLVSAINWRLERNLSETIIQCGESVSLKPESERSADDKGFIAQYRSGKSYVHAADRENRLIYIIRVRLHDPRAQSSQSMESYTLHNIENLRIAIKPPNDKVCLIFDMTGFGVKNMDFHVVRFLVTVFEARYPETLGVVLIRNAPFVFWGIWSMIKGWLDPVIASKINFTRKSADLLRFISEENLQTSYGGKDSWEYEYIEPVPGENKRFDEVEKKAEIQGERDELVREFELQTVEWASKESDAKDKASRRNELADQLSGNYWKLDPYIRARTYFHRVGMVGND
ncbi:CRAL/TRIO domain-containing protein [Xylariaceae sp. AK1471]|nr:CRAL/TRIO domain-containing protein [Xylariaceae sp. AK1471]